MEAIETNDRQQSERSVAEDLLVEYATYTTTVRECTHEKKRIELELLELAEQHEEWFKGKTAALENGKLRFAAISSVELPEGFEMSKFRRKYPHLVKVTEKIETNKVRSYLDDPKFSKEGIGIATRDKFVVEV